MSHAEEHNADDPPDVEAPAWPAAYLERLQRIFAPDDVERVLASAASAAPVTLRVNTLRAREADVVAELADIGLECEPVPWCPGALVVRGFRSAGAGDRRSGGSSRAGGPPPTVSPVTSVHRSDDSSGKEVVAGSAPSTDEGAPRSTDSADQRRDILRALQATAAAAAGRVYVQGLASQAVPLVLDPQPDDEILDMAAAPGSKTTQIAALMEGRGRLVANDRSRGRIYKLRAVLEQQGVHEVQVSQRPGESLGRLWSERFDRVLLDAPCSMEARFRADDPSSWDGWSPGRIKRLAGLQGRLLASAVRAVGPGGVVVYSTCTFAPEENEVVLHRALRRFAGVIELEQVELDLPQRRPGLTAWGARDLDPSLSRAVRLVPDGVVEGFFIARLRKLASTAR